MAMETSTTVTVTEGSTRTQRNQAFTNHTAHHSASATGKPLKSTKTSISRSNIAKIPSPHSRNNSHKISETTKQSLRNGRAEKVNTKPNQIPSENSMHVLPNGDNVEGPDVRECGSKDRDHDVPVLEDDSFLQTHGENPENVELSQGVLHSDPDSFTRYLQEPKSLSLLIIENSKLLVTEKASGTQACLVDMSSSLEGAESVVEEAPIDTETVGQLHAVESKERSLEGKVGAESIVEETPRDTETVGHLHAVDGISLLKSNDGASVDCGSASIPQGDQIIQQSNLQTKDTDNDLIKRILETSDEPNGINDGSYVMFTEHLTTEQEKFLFSKGQASVNGATNDNVEVKSLSVLPSPAKKSNNQTLQFGDVSATAVLGVTQEVLPPLPCLEASMGAIASNDELVQKPLATSHSCKATSSSAQRRVLMFCLILALALVCSTWFFSRNVDEMYFPPPT